MKRLTVISGAAALLALLMSGCGTKSGGSGQTAADSLERVQVKTTLTHVGPVEMIAEFTGNIEADVVNNIGSNMPVRINKILVEVGSRVTAGQLLVQMDQTSYIQASVQLANAEQDYKRMKNVYEAGGMARQQLDQMEVQLTVLREQAASLKDNTELRSPVDGIVTARYFDAGDLYSMTPNASGSAAILTVMRINPLKVTMNVSEQFFPTVRKGMEVEINLDLFPDKTFRGAVSLIYPSIDAATRTFTVEVSIPNPDYTLRPGMFCRTTLRLGEMQAIMLSDLAVHRQVGTAERFVFVIKDGIAERRTVEIGRRVGDMHVILSGLDDNEEVVVAGASRLADGTPVEVVK